MTPEEKAAKREEAVDAAYDKIMSDIGFTPPELWHLAQEKIRIRLERMADFLLPDEEDA